MKVKISKEFAEEVTIVYLKELYENLVVDQVRASTSPSSNQEFNRKDNAERTQWMTHTLGVLRGLLTGTELKDFLEEVHLKHYGEKRT